MLGSLALLVLMSAGLLYIVGATSLAKRLLLFGIALAIFASLIEENLSRFASGTEQHLSNLSAHLGLIVGLALTGLGLVGYRRYRSHRDKHWVEEL